MAVIAYSYYPLGQSGHGFHEYGKRRSVTGDFGPPTERLILTMVLT